MKETVFVITHADVNTMLAILAGLPTTGWSTSAATKVVAHAKEIQEAADKSPSGKVMMEIVP